jgi:hypothetical protein
MAEKNATQQWSEDVAAFVVDTLLHAKIVQKEQCERAIEIAAEEIFVRLCLKDYPPPIEES